MATIRTVATSMATATPASVSTAAAPAAAAPVVAAPSPADPRALIWSLEALGWAPCEAGNVVALAHGLRPARLGWTIREIEHLRFLRSLVRAGRIAS